MIELVRNRDNTRFSVIVNEKLIVSTKSLAYATAVLDSVTNNNDLSLAESTFKPIKFNLQGPKTTQI